MIGTPALAGATLFVPLADRLAAIDVTSGSAFWSSPLSPATGVVVAGGSPYLATSDDRLVGFSAGPVPPPVVIHDAAIVSLHVPRLVSRQMDAPVTVTLANQGTQAETCELLLRVQPGRVVIADEKVTLAAGETKGVTIPWPTPLMGDDGPKALVAELFLQGPTDSTPGDNQALQLVTVGP
jgi:hypothetical protein